MNCINCGVSMFDKPLSRTNPKGQPDAGWMCQDCIKIKEPELFNNLKEDGEFKVTNDIFNAINGKQETVHNNNAGSENCPVCGASEINAMTPRTVYACGSSDYDQRSNTFSQSEKCKP